MIIVNFKTYNEATGEKAGELLENCEKVSKEEETSIVASPQTQDIRLVDGTSVEVFSQHLDSVDPGSHTGSVLAEGVKAAGASGTLVNHSERRIPDKVEEVVEKAREKGLITVVCAQNPGECEKFARFKPDYIAYEPPELIGGDLSVSSAKPELIEKAVEKSGDVPTLTGAGIKNAEDVEKSLELGCEGVLVASGVVKAEDSYEALKELCRGHD